MSHFYDCLLTCCLNACHQLLSAIGILWVFCLFFLLRMAVCVCLYTDNTVVLVTCLFSSGCCQRTERRERRACCFGACELLTVLMHLYLSRCIQSGLLTEIIKWIIFLCGFVMKSETRVALFKLGAIYFFSPGYADWRATRTRRTCCEYWQPFFNLFPTILHLSPETSKLCHITQITHLRYSSRLLSCCFYKLTLY